MTEMPEKIWAVQGNGVLHRDITATHIENNLYAATPYTRTDLHESLTAERDALRAEVERLRGAIKTHAGCFVACKCGEEIPCRDDDVVLALKGENNDGK